MSLSGADTGFQFGGAAGEKRTSRKKPYWLANKSPPPPKGVSDNGPPKNRVDRSVFLFDFFFTTVWKNGMKLVMPFIKLFFTTVWKNGKKLVTTSILSFFYHCVDFLNVNSNTLFWLSHATCTHPDENR